MEESRREDRVWIQYKTRWYPAVLETWNRRDGVLRQWVTYAVPVIGWHGGWYESVLGDDGEDPNEQGLNWVARVGAARLEAERADSTT